MNSDGTQHSRSPGQYLDEAMFRQLRHATKGEVRQAILIGNLVLAMGKSVVFGVLIALIGCHWGLKVEPNTQSLGRGTTAAVVSSITMVIIVDAIFAILFRNVGF